MRMRTWWPSTRSIIPLRRWMNTLCVKKSQALRTVYKKELNKVEKSLKSGAGTDDVYVPKLWYYDLLAFTRDQEIPRPCQTVTSICAPSPEENLPESPDEHVPLQQRERPEGNDVQSHQSSRSPCLEDQTRPQRPSRKRKSTAGTPVDLLAMANNILSKHAATQLSAFPTLQTFHKDLLPYGPDGTARWAPTIKICRDLVLKTLETSVL
ncbi:unnamed protein product [Ranitomeya imitator]|uniref:MADF domain-containing protein n=1 Tax=Ranitomeya imitator TaxID=111125 RepID=A0ABN9MNY0_9NEOB|nr:unnamed protein product [Ranitomeya imitator]